MTVAADPKLMDSEKEIIIRGVKDSDTVRVFTEIPSHARSLLNHDHFTVTEKREVDGNVVAVGGDLPLACLSITTSPRSDDYHSRVISSGD